jgi:hypothetical protein
MQATPFGLTGRSPLPQAPKAGMGMCENLNNPMIF